MMLSLRSLLLLLALALLAMPTPAVALRRTASAVSTSDDISDGDIDDPRHQRRELWDFWTLLAEGARIL